MLLYPTALRWLSQTGCGKSRWLVLFACGWLGLNNAARAQRVELELITDEGFSAVNSQRWISTLKALDLANLRIRSGRPGDRIEIRERGGENSRSYAVTGLLTTRNTLRLPGGEFRLSDTTAIRDWVAKVREGGEARLQERQGAFGLTPSQLIATHEKLQVPVSFSTKGEPTFIVLQRLAASISIPFRADASVRKSLSAELPVGDELEGLSAGTAVAAVLRPLGLVMVPRKDGGEIKLWIVRVQDAMESWPVGWPSEKSPRETMPELFQFLNVEIEDTPLSTALQAVGGRLKARMLLDHNALARHQIDPDTVKVTLPSGRTYYQRIIDRLLYQAELTNDLRVDEAGQAFLWISTRRK